MDCNCMKVSGYIRILVAAVAMSAAAVASAATNYEVTAVKASRFFEWREWASAEALYGLMLAEKPDVDSTYVKAIVAASMIGHTDAASHLLTQAMKAGVSFPRLMAGVKTVSFEVGAANVYEDFLLRSQRDCPWLERAIDAELLKYYRFRDNGELIVRYARKMLAGVPQSVDYLSALAEGYVITGDYDSAIAAWQKILEVSPEDYLTLLKLGNYYANAGQREEALEYLGRAEAVRATPYVTQRLASLDSVGKKL